MLDRSDDSSHHERTLLPRSYVSLHHERSIRRPIAPWANALTTELHLAPPWEIDPTTHCTMSERSYHGATSRSTMRDRSDDPSHHERTLLPRSYVSLRNDKKAQWLRYVSRAVWSTNSPVNAAFARQVRHPVSSIGTHLRELFLRLRTALLLQELQQRPTCK